jgi:adenine-specific DNA-methyltransferase
MNKEEQGAGELYLRLIEQLKCEPNFVSDDGELKKWVVAEAARAYSADVISLLLKDEVLRNAFFVNVNGTEVFKLDKFLLFVEQKNYLNDGYTQFSQKVGLKIGGKFLNQRSEVELVFPHKDCVLEGGQTKEDQKRQEIFFNEVLAQDEITQLLEPKVLTGGKRYDSEGEHPLDGFVRDAEINEKRGLPKDTITDNLIIKGNNLLTLHTLKREFAGRVKMIYIDPPYYFRNNPATDTFKYNSNFHLSTWLVFMKDRLKIAKSLLMAGGTIWISMGDDGMHYLKMIADDVFGRDYFVGTLPRRTRSGKSDVPFNFSQDFDWLLVYTNVSDDKDVVGRSVERKYYETDDYPGEPWRLADLTKQTTAKERPNSFFTMVDPKTGKKYPASEKRTWNVSKDTFQEYYDRGEIIFPDDYDFLKITKPYARKFKKEDDAKGKLSAVISDIQIQNFLKALLYDCKNQEGNNEINDLFGRDEFDYAKPENLIKTIIDVTTKEKDIVLDFFSGSGTTAAVAHKLNRQYIACEQIDHQMELNVNRLKQVIEGDDVGISDDVDWQGGGSFIYLELKKYNQVFIDEIESGTKTEELLSIWEKMKQKAFFRFNVDMQKFDEGIEEFKALALEQQKECLCKMLDLNQLYVNRSDMEDETAKVTEEEKRITKNFYQEA